MCLVQLSADLLVLLTCFAEQFISKHPFVEEGGKRDEVVIVGPRSGRRTVGFLSNETVLMYLGWHLSR